jgi:hypothetical protein
VFLWVLTTYTAGEGGRNAREDCQKHLHTADSRQQMKTEDIRQKTEDNRQQAAKSRQQTADSRQLTSGDG